MFLKKKDINRWEIYKEEQKNRDKKEKFIKKWSEYIQLLKIFINAKYLYLLNYQSITYRKMQKKAMEKIELFFYRCLQLFSGRKYRHAIYIIRASAILSAQNRRLNRKKHAANIIQNFLRAMQNTDDIKTAVLMFLRRIRSLQNILRNILAIRHAKRELIKLYWEKNENIPPKTILQILLSECDNKTSDYELLKYLLDYKYKRFNNIKVNEETKMKYILLWWKKMYKKMYKINKDNLREYNKEKSVKYTEEDINEILYGNKDILEIVNKYNHKPPFKYQSINVIKSLNNMNCKSIIKQCIIDEYKKEIDKLKGIDI